MSPFTSAQRRRTARQRFSNWFADALDANVPRAGQKNGGDPDAQHVGAGVNVLPRQRSRRSNQHAGNMPANRNSAGWAVDQQIGADHVVEESPESQSIRDMKKRATHGPSPVGADPIAPSRIKRRRSAQTRGRSQ
jgi:hypothetical protein